MTKMLIRKKGNSNMTVSSYSTGYVITKWTVISGYDDHGMHPWTAAVW